MKTETWPPEWTRATLAHSALAIIAADGTTYGYRILQRLEEAGFGTIKGGTLYPILSRLETDGMVTSHWGEGEGGPGRKFISITDAGKDEVRRLSDSWPVFTAAVARLWNVDAPATPGGSRPV